MAETSITDPREAFEDLTSKVRALRAMLQMTCGQAREEFEGMSDELRDDYMGACVELANECKPLLESLAPVVYGKAISHG